MYMPSHPIKIHFTIQDEANESRMRAACLIEEVQRLLDRQSGLYSVYSDAIHKYKSSKDATAFANARKKLDGDYRSITNQITQVQISLTKEQPEAAEKVRAELSLVGMTTLLLYVIRIVWDKTWITAPFNTVPCGLCSSRLNQLTRFSLPSITAVDLLGNKDIWLNRVKRPHSNTLIGGF